LHFYSDPDARVDTKKNAKAWQNLQSQLDSLQQRKTPPAEAGPSVLHP
jgi:hypothetical protein